MILIGLGKLKVCVNLSGIGENPLSFYLKEVEKEKPNPRELHKVFFLKP